MNSEIRREIKELNSLLGYKPKANFIKIIELLRESYKLNPLLDNEIVLEKKTAEKRLRLYGRSVKITGQFLTPIN